MNFTARTPLNIRNYFSGALLYRKYMSVRPQLYNMYIALTAGNIIAQAVALTYVIGRLQGREKRNGSFSMSNSL